MDNKNFTALEHSTLKNTVIMKSGSGVNQGHQKWYHSIACLWFPISFLY